jgi:hypothetical protein
MLDNHILLDSFDVFMVLATSRHLDYAFGGLLWVK